MPVWLCRSAMVVLTVGVLFGQFARGAQTTEGRAEPAPAAAVGLMKASVQSSLLTPTSLSPFSRWKTRLKTILTETDPRILEEPDLGPALMPSVFGPLASSAPIAPHRLAPLRMRC
jgi:hypothetical protein